MSLEFGLAMAVLLAGCFLVAFIAIRYDRKRKM